MPKNLPYNKPAPASCDGGVNTELDGNLGLVGAGLFRLSLIDVNYGEPAPTIL
ncbi:MAG: hypothetical protein HC849_03220 [Oscillatoriales cyanobacterium RU_3_3]|nr:hypothetical protein [Oscillatoriales cyanobacterium RU_3_3]